ncbi:MAG: hypothetical protein K2L21_04620 [Muribaculaceae bacterium]|nr:hypothetical protein [Muribaculaceae bacterium]
MILATCGTSPRAADSVDQLPRVEWSVSVNEPITRDHQLFGNAAIGSNENLRSILYSGMGVCNAADTTSVGSILRARDVEFSEYDLTYGWLELEDSTDCDLVIYSRKPLLSENVEVDEICYLPDDDMNVLVLFKFDDAMAWQHITSSYIGKRLAIVVNGEVVNAPVVNASIESGNCSVLLPRRIAYRFLPGWECPDA